MDVSQRRLRGLIVPGLVGLALVALAAILAIQHFGGSLTEETYNTDSGTVTSTIGSCSQSNGVLDMTATTTTNRVGLVQVTIYALAGQHKYEAHRTVSLGMMSPTQGSREWTFGVVDAKHAWGCGLATTIGPPPPLPGD
jgi:hypothetical protein